MLSKPIVLLLAAVTCLALAQVAGADASFTDPVGDSGAAADITAVTVANDAVGNLTFTVRTNASTLGDAQLVILWIDSDRNAKTGDDGIEAFFGIGSAGWELNRWDGSQYVAGAPSANATYINGVATFKVNKADLGNTEGLAFWVDSWLVDAEGHISDRDTSPDGNNIYEYTLTKPAPPAPLRLTAGTVTFSPAKAAAGKPLSARTTITRSDTHGPLASGTVSCRVQVAGKAVRFSGALRGGVATCTGKLPASAKRQVVRGTITVVSGGASVTKSFSIRAG